MIDLNKLVSDYLEKLKILIDALPQDDLVAIIKTLQAARINEKTIFVCGNGGSAATASHMVCDLSKNTRKPTSNRVRVVGLGDNLPSVTAYANDEGYDRIFAEPLLSLMRPEDILLAISGSGNSPNVVSAVEAAKELGGYCIALTGFEGGKLKGLVDQCLVVPSDNMEQIEDLHMIVNHILTMSLRES